MLLTLAILTPPAVGSYANTTLSSGDLSVTIFLPYGVKPTEDTYYMGTRFEHSSMIGPIQRKSTQVVEREGEIVGELVDKVHRLFGDDLWRLPHNANWPESGVGLASEFGVGDDGDFCPYRCGWGAHEGVTNGVLGYQSAKVGESFLKVGVGELVKGSCPHCDSSGEYKFNSPYKFAQLPIWIFEQPSPNTVRLEHSAVLGVHGYRMQKEVVVDNDTLIVTTTLTNLGQESFSTAWYSHNFFTCDSLPVGPGYSLELGIRGNRSPLFDEPATWTWATPIRNFVSVEPHPNSVHLKVTKPIPPGIRVKAEFLDDGETTGQFQLNACRNSIWSDISGNLGNLEMYAYNVYIERGTLSPEPQILLHLDPGATQSWSQRIHFDDLPLSNAGIPSITGLRANSIFGSASKTDSSIGAGIVATYVGVACMAVLLGLAFGERSRERVSYEAIPDATNPSSRTETE